MFVIHSSRPGRVPHPSGWGLFRAINEPPARNAPRNTLSGWPTPRCPVIADRSGGVGVLLNKIRLSATDISALASMKNVAKCDTWCELQNPVNHRVFERKLRPKLSGRGHVCLGVTHRVAPPARPSVELGERMMASRSPKGRGWPKCESLATDVTASGGRAQCALSSRRAPRRSRANDPHEPR